MRHPFVEQESFRPDSTSKAGGPEVRGRSESGGGRVGGRAVGHRKTS